MAAGLPGTGIGGLFYILLCGFMPFYHFVRAVKGGHKSHHTKTGIIVIVLAVGILASLYGEAKLLIWLANKAIIVNTQAGNAMMEVNSGNLSEAGALADISPALALLPFIILFTVLTFVQILRLIFHGFKRKSKEEEAAVISPLHGEKVA